MLAFRCVCSALFVVALAGCGGRSAMLPPAVQQPATASERAPASLPDIVQHDGKSWTHLVLKAQYAKLEGIAAGTDGNEWVAGGGNTLFRVNPKSGAQTPFVSPGNGYFPYPDYLAVGADGNFYVDDCYGQIAVVTTQGLYLNNGVPYTTKEYVCGSLALGSDQNVWFAEYDLFGSSGGYAGKIATNGTVTEYPLGGPGNSVWLGTTSGPDGNIWMVDSANGYIARVVPATGAVTLFSSGGTSGATNVTCAPHGPYSIVSGADGNLYYDCGYYLGKITTSGATSFVSNPNNFSSAGGSGSEVFANAPDGTLWFAAASPGLVERYDTATGTLTKFQSPFKKDELFSTAFAPDGNLWVTTYNDHDHVDILLLQAISVTPKTLAFTAVGQMQTISIAEAGTTAWTVTSSKAAVVTCAKSTASTYLCTANGSGTAKVTVRDARGNSVAVAASVP